VVECEGLKDGEMDMHHVSHAVSYRRSRYIKK